MNTKNYTQPPQHQSKQPGVENIMNPKPISIYDYYKGSNKLKNKIALITGGDSGIGRAVAYHFALEGAKVIITYLNEHEDAEETLLQLKTYGVECMSIAEDLRSPDNCKKIISDVIKKFNRIDCLINNAAVQFVQSNFEQISPEQLDITFKTNMYAYFYLTQAALPYMHEKSTIINSTSVTAYRGSEHLIDYAATKGAIVAYTRSLAKLLIKKNIRVNAVAPGPVWTPLIPASFPSEKVAHFGEKTLLEEPAQPADIAPSYVFLASEDSRYFIGQVLHPNGGEIINT